MIKRLLRKLRNLLTMDVGIFSVMRIANALEGAPFRLRYLEGKGSYTVFAVVDKNGRALYIIKVSNGYRGARTKNVIENKRRQYRYLTPREKFSREEGILKILSKEGLSPTPVSFTDKYSVEEYISGDKISDIVKSGREDAPILILEALKAVSRMHSLGVIHGDLRPYNVLMEGDRARFIDFEHSLDPNAFSLNQMRAFDYLIFLNELDRINPEILSVNKIAIREEMSKNIPGAFTKDDVTKVMEEFKYAEHFSSYFF